MYYKNVEYAKGRLKNSIVNTEDGNPVYVIDIHSTDDVTVHDLKTEVRSNTVLPSLDLTPVKLGWVNMGKYVVFTSRVPIRGVWKQGLCKDNIRFSSSSGPVGSCPIPCPQLGATILGEFPTFREVVNKLKVDKTCTGIAFARNWALAGRNLLYKGRVVGSYTDGYLSLDRSNQYLEDVLQEEAGVGCGYC